MCVICMCVMCDMCDVCDMCQGAEWLALWEAVCGSLGQVAVTAGTALVQLVLSDVADFTLVLHGLLNRVPSAR